jgi:hypothetical protein
MALVQKVKKEEAYEFRPFPKWKYHRSMQPVLVHSPAAELALGDDWVDNPGEFAEDEGPGKIDPDDHKKFYGLTQADVIDRIDAMTKDDIGALTQLRAIEIANPNPKAEGGRPKVIQAIGEKLEALAKEE